MERLGKERRRSERERLRRGEERLEECKECGKLYLKGWCQACNSKHFCEEFKDWTSGNEIIDRFLQTAQLMATDPTKVLEWIPFKKLANKRYIAQGGFGIVYSATWLDGPIQKWNINHGQWDRLGEIKVALKILFNSTGLSHSFLKEVESYSKIEDTTFFIRLLGISRDDNTQNYIMIMEFATLGSLYEYFKSNTNSMAWETKIKALYDISLGLNHLHDSSLIHQDLHPGNLLFSSNAGENFLNIADLGLCKPSDQDPQSNEASVIYGVMPYIAPEVLYGKKHTLESDIYSFGFIAYQIVTGILPYHNISHDFDLALSIVKGLRPEIPYYIPRSIAKLILQCWDARPEKRPTSKVLYQTIEEWYYDIRRNRNSEFTAQIKRAEEISEDSSTYNTLIEPHYKTHPNAIYSSRLLNFANLSPPVNSSSFDQQLKKLLEEENDSKFVIPLQFPETKGV